MWLLASTTTVTSLLLRRRFNNKSVSSKSCRAAMQLLIHQTSFFTTTTTFNSSSSSSSKFGDGGTFILHRQANNNLHTTTTSSPYSSSEFGTIILQTNEPSVDLDSFDRKKDDIKMFMLSSSSSSGSGEENKDDDDQKMVFKLDEDLGFSAFYKDFQLEDSIRMVGSCNGIVCLHDPKLHWPQLLRDVYLWNPATRHFRILPQSIYIEEQTTYNAFKDFVGFGFDVETQDYKVLWICPHSYRKDAYMCRVQVYSLSTDSWRVLDGVDSLPVSPTQDVFRNRQGTYLNGSCFFLGSKPINHKGIRDLMLLSFDFTKEIFTTMKLPKCYCHKLVFSDSGEEHDFDALLTSSPRLLYDIRADKPVVFRTPRIHLAGGYVFTTDEIDFEGGGGGGGYWYYKMWNVRHCRLWEEDCLWWKGLRVFRIKTKSKHPPYSEPRCVSNDGEFALISTTLTDDNGRTKLMLFNLATGKAIKDFTIGDHRNCRAAYVYKESQVSIMGGGNAFFRWQLPTHGTTYKLNLDAPFIDDEFDLGPFGIGLCLTSDTGGCIGVRSLHTFVLDSKIGEAQAMYEAINWAKELELSPIIIESDSKNMVSFFMEDDDNLLTYWSSEDEDHDFDNYSSSAVANSFLEEAKNLLKSYENRGSISFQYCSRSSNYVAEIASKLGRDRTTWSCKDWTANFPGEVVISGKDLGLET